MADTYGPGIPPLRSIGDHGIIGDMETAALVARDGTIDYLCWPSLDSPTVFADLLDREGGAFAILPALTDPAITQLYVPDTNVLLTRWMAEDGSAELVDLMPHPDARVHPDRVSRCLIRRITVTRGTVTFDAICAPRFDYAREIPTVSPTECGIRFEGQDLVMQLFASVPLVCDAGAMSASFTLAAGESAWFVLGEQALACPDDEAIDAEIASTIAAWRGWVAKTSYTGRWREHVLRSALALKLLTSARHGSIAAAATFSLPETAGGERNWDYRASWIRDASFTTYAFMRLGFITRRNISTNGRASAFLRQARPTRSASCTRSTARRRRTNRSLRTLPAMQTADRSASAMPRTRKASSISSVNYSTACTCRTNMVARSATKAGDISAASSPM